MLIIDNLKLNCDAVKIARLEERLSTNIIDVNLLTNSATIVYPREVLDEIESNNRKVEWIQEKNSMPPRRGTRPVWLKDTERFLNDVNETAEQYKYDVMDAQTTHSLSANLEWIFDRFLNSMDYMEKVEVNI